MPAIQHRVLPGFRLGLTFTLTWVGVLVIVPLAGCLLKASSLSLDRFIAAAWSARARAAYSFTFGSSLAAAAINVLIGLLVAWVLVRYEFIGKRLIDSLVDLPFALPTAVAGLVYSQLYVPNGWLGRFLVPLGIEAAYSRLAVVLVLVFVGFPFVVRTLQPVLESFDAEVEEAASLLGASRGQTFRRVIMPALTPALMTGFALSFARAIGEYGSVVFVSGNMPFRTEIAPVLIVARLEEFAYGEATAIATVLLAMSLGMLLVVNFLEHWSKRHDG
jgi:sulfate transport system permease protein